MNAANKTMNAERANSQSEANAKIRVKLRLILSSLVISKLILIKYNAETARITVIVKEKLAEQRRIGEGSPVDLLNI